MSNKFDMTNKELVEKWDFLLEADEFGKISSLERKVSTAKILENATREMDSGAMELVPTAINEGAAPTNQTGGVKNYDPVLISMLRRAAPKLISNEILGVQPLAGPTGQIFAMRARYANQTGTEAFYGEANTGHSTVRGGNTAIVGDATLNVGTVISGNTAAYNFAAGMSLPQGEALGSTGNVAFREMAISIENVLVRAETRKLKASYTHEFAQDLKAIHGLDAAKELSNVLSTELISELNREVLRSIYITGVNGSPASRVTTAGTIDLDVDTNGRWSAERWVGLHMQLELESNDIAKATRRGKGNILLTSSNVASALRAAKILDVTEAAKLQIDDTGNTFAGMVGNIKVFIDPYATADFAVLGYKGQSNWDAGLYWCPYVPLQQIRAVDPETLQPVIGFQTRNGMVANPFSGGATASDGKLVANSNVYYRKSLITNIM